MTGKKRVLPKLKDTSVQVLDMYKSGMLQKDIADRMGMKYTRVAGIIWRARQRGELDNPRANMPPEKRLALNIRARFKLIGSVKKAMLNSMTPESFEHMLTQADRGGYENISEYLIDLAVDEYFKENKNADNG